MRQFRENCFLKKDFYFLNIIKKEIDYCFNFRMFQFSTNIFITTFYNFQKKILQIQILVKGSQFIQYINLLIISVFTLYEIYALYFHYTI